MKYSWSRPGVKLFLSAALAVACRGSDTPPATIDGVSRRVHGDTTIVVTERDGVWGPAHDAVEVKRVAGISDTLPFGQLRWRPVATADGGVIVVDTKGAQGPAIYQFNSEGAFLRTIGRRGEGPGEFNFPSQLTMAATRNGGILVRDWFRVVNRYDSAGRFLSGFVLSGGRGGQSGMSNILGADDGTIRIDGRLPAASIGTPPVLRFDTSGKLLDSVFNVGGWLPKPTLQGIYTPREAWTILPDGRAVLFRSDKLGFLVTDPAHKVKPLIGETPATPVAFLDEERTELEGVRAFIEKEFPPNARGAADKLPRAKQPAQGVLTDRDGRIWIYKTVTAQKIKPRVGAMTDGKSVMVSYAVPPVLVAFQSDGTLLGEVRFPKDMIGPPALVGDYAWAIIPDADDVLFLVKYRLHQ